MKKILAILLALMLILALVACDSDSDFDDDDDDEIEDERDDEEDDDDDKMTFDPGDDDTEEDPSGESVDTETEAEIDTETEAEPETEETPAMGTVAPDTEAPEDTGPVEDVSVIGHTYGCHYENAYFGLACDFDEDYWYVANEEELAELFGIVVETTASEALEKELEESGVVFALYASDYDGVESVNITVEDLGIIYGLTLSEQDYINLAEETLVESVESAGFENVVIEKTTMILAGEEHAAVKLSAQISDIDIYETIAVVKSGNYVACVTASSYVTDVTAELLAAFYAP